MDNKRITTGNSKMIEGVNKVVDTIKVTLGPKGRCVAIGDGFDTPNITRDGATVAKAIALKDQEENMGAQIVKHAAKITEAVAGDGTSSTSVLLQEIIRQGLKHDGEGLNLNEVKSGLEKAQSWVTEYIKNNALEVAGDLEKIRKVATISANNDPGVGEYIVDGMKKVGIDGVLTTEISSALETSLEIKDGFRIDRGWVSPYFVTSPQDGTCDLQNVKIFVCGERISTIPQMQSILSGLIDPQSGGIKHPILIICDDIDEVVLAQFAYNVMKGALRCCIIKGVDFGDNRKNIMADIATAVGAVYVCQENGLSLDDDTTIDYFGSARQAVITKDSTIIYDGAGDKTLISERLTVLKEMLAQPEITDYEKQKLQRRVASLGGGICVIKAGGASEMEKINRKQTIEDAILASKSAISEGVVPGGGSLFLRSIPYIESKVKTLTGDEKIGAQILVDSLPIIVKTIAENSGIPGNMVIDNVLKSKKLEYGYNAKTGKYGDLLEMGVLDSAKVLRVSLENAVSGAGMVLLTQKNITSEPEIITPSDCGCSAHGCH